MLRDRARGPLSRREESKRAEPRGPREDSVNNRALTISKLIDKIREDLELNPCVYEPSDDTWLAAEALTALAKEGRRYHSIIEIGSGTGVLALLAYELFKPLRLVATDLSPYAVRVSRRNLPPEILVARCDGASCLEAGWDLAILNPPYLPIEPRNLSPRDCDDWLDLAWSGASSMKELVLEAVRVAREAVIVSSSLSPVRVEEIAVREGKRARVIASRRFFFEEIIVHHIEL